MKRPYIKVESVSGRECYIFTDEILRVYDDIESTIIKLRDSGTHNCNTSANDIMKLIDEALAVKSEDDRLLTFNAGNIDDPPDDYIIKRAVRVKDVMRISTRVDGKCSITCKNPEMAYRSSDSFESLVAKLGWEHQEVKETENNGRLTRKMDKP